MIRGLFIVLCLSLSLIACSKNDILDDIHSNNGSACQQSKISISPGDSIALANISNPIYFNGAFTAEEIEISYSQIVDVNGETETLFFVFEKQTCLKLNRVYKLYDGKKFDTTNITEAEIIDFGIQDWIEDELISGFVTYKDPHDKLTYTKKFWVRLQPKPTINVISFADCIGNRLPLEIDLNSDGLTDFYFDYDLILDVGNKPTYNEYTIVLKSSSSDNAILSPKKTSAPYFVIFEPPFSSQNTQQYFGGVKKALDIFYEFEAPYEAYSLFLNNNLTYSEVLNNSLNDYYLVSMRINGDLYYGYIQFRFSSQNCALNVLDKYLHSKPNEHILVN